MDIIRDMVCWANGLFKQLDKVEKVWFRTAKLAEMSLVSGWEAFFQSTPTTEMQHNSTGFRIIGRHNMQHKLLIPKPDFSISFGIMSLECSAV
jgi:hypothetical protein